MKQITKRLLPGQDLRNEMEKIAKDYDIQAGCVLSIVGGLQKATLRMAGGKTAKSWEGPLEIIAGTGTVSVNGCHIHIAISDTNGATFGGHLKKGCIISTTAEVAILSFPDIKYERKFDEKTGYDELEVKE